jgi:HSP20 family protein
VFQQGDEIPAVIELPGINRNDLKIQAKDNTIRISGKKSIEYPDGVSVHRREGMFENSIAP